MSARISPDVLARARELVGDGLSHREAHAQLLAEGAKVSIQWVERRVPVSSVRRGRTLPAFGRPRYPGTLSAWDLGKLRATPGWRAHSRQWRLAKALERHVGALVEFDTLSGLSGFTRGSLANRLTLWRSAGIVVDQLVDRGRLSGVLRVIAVHVDRIEFPIREQMIDDVLNAMHALGGESTPYRIALTAGWDPAAVRRLLIALDRDRVVYEVVSDRPGVRLYTLPRGWS